ncbi:MAG: S8 family serine peptidase, partial [Clostridia bacterium]|nr:S8 family serine peptidase [Clostridia bacterium]
VLLVSAVGNKGSNVLYYPAAYECVIGVGAVDKNLNVCEFSNTGNISFSTDTSLTFPGVNGVIFFAAVNVISSHSISEFNTTETPDVVKLPALSLSLFICL